MLLVNLKTMLMFAVVVVATAATLFFSVRAVSRSGHAVPGGFAAQLVKGLSLFVQRPLLTLILWMVIATAWYGHAMFSDPYRYSYNHGNGAYYAQVLKNVVAGHGPEQTTKYTTLNLETNPTFYASSFALVPHVLPLLVLSPIYALHPSPPMHVFAIVILIIAIGVPGVYVAIRAMGGSRGLSLLGAIGYSVVPWVVIPMFFMGAFDNIGFALYPWVFAALFLRRGWMLCLASLLLASIGIAYAYAAIAVGAVAFIFFGQRRAGMAVVLIGAAMALWETALMKQALVGVTVPGALREGLVQSYLMGSKAWVLIVAAGWHLSYVLTFIVASVFLPLLVIRKGDRWNKPMLGMFVFAGAGIVMAMLRGYGIQYHRNVFIVTPLYLSMFLAYVILCAQGPIVIGWLRRPFSPAVIGTAFFAMMTSMMLWGGMHVPWSAIKKPFLATGDGRVMQSLWNDAAREEKARECRRILATIAQYVPDDAAISYRIESGIEAFVTNRQRAWHFGEHPDGVEYFIIQTKPIDFIDPDFPLWEESFKRLRSSTQTTTLYSDARLTILSNAKAAEIPRNDEALGWSLLWKALIPKGWSS